MQRFVIAAVLAVACPATGFDANANLRGHALAQQQPMADADEDAGPEEAPTREELLMAGSAQQAVVAAPQAALRNPILPHVMAQPQLQKRVQYRGPPQQIQQQPKQQVQYQQQEQPMQPMQEVPQATMQEMVHEAEPAPAQMSAQQLQQMQQQLLQQQQLIQRQQHELQMQQQDFASEPAPQIQPQRPPQALPVQAAPVTMASLPKEWPQASADEAPAQQPPTKSLVAVGSRAGTTGGEAAGAATGTANGGVMSTLNGMPAAKPKGWDQCLRFARFVKSQGVTGQELVRVWTGTCTPAVRSGLATQRYKLMCSSLAGVVEPFGAQLDYSIDKLCSDVLAVFHDVTASDAAAR